MADERELARLFASQEGLATMRQLELVGVTRSAVRHRLTSGEWERVSRTVVAASNTPWTWHRHVRAGWLDAGADTRVSHTTAGRIHRFDGLDRELGIHIESKASHHPTSLAGVTMHRSMLYDQRERVWIAGIAVVTKPIALMQLAASWPSNVAGQALDGALRDGASPLWIATTARRFQASNGKGATTLLAMLDERVGKRLPRSWFQRLASTLFRALNIRLIDEYPVFDPGGGALLAELDLALPELKIGVECQSWRWHGAPGAGARDTRRRRRLRMLGWEIVDVWWEDLHRLDEVAEEVRYLIARRGGEVLT